MPVHFHSEIPGFSLKGKQKFKEWINKAITDHSLKTGDLNFIFCSDEYLHKINIEYLNHDTFTDIITFPHVLPGKEDRINGDIYISIDRVKENALKFEVDDSFELQRVIIHGVLHLCGYKDKKPAEQKEMRKAENRYLSYFQK